MDTVTQFGNDHMGMFIMSAHDPFSQVKGEENQMLRVYQTF